MKNLLPIILVALGVSASAQQLHRCYTTEAMYKMEEHYPGYLDAANQTFEMAKEHAQLKSGSQEIFRIPVVVHVVYNTTDENISDDLVRKQIEVLNEDYRRMNADTNVTRSEFKPVAADAGIEFYLATTDPDGNWTTGITHTPTDETSFVGISSFTPDGIKKSASGGVDAWPTDRYLNIWVGDLSLFGSPFILGFAYPPVGAPNWPAGQFPSDSTLEGVVVHYEVFGRGNPLASGPLAVTDRGRTCTHEVGHYLGLRHIWGDGGGFSGTDGCTVDDGITDTPNSADASQQTCDLDKNTCTDSTADLKDMIENFMDYSEEACMNMFTQGQVDIMRSILETTRNPLVQDFAAGISPYDLSNLGLEVYPNPSAGVFNVAYDNQATEVLNVEILDSYGRLVSTEYTNQMASSTFTLDMTGYAKGVYFARFIFAEGSKVSKLVVE